MNSDVVVIGGGIVGLSTAWQLLQKNSEISVTVLEKENTIANHQTGNNSGVIHSGIYYKPGSLKAENCIRGYHMLIEFCKQENIPYDLCGKIIVATSTEEFGSLESIYQRGIQNGLSGLRFLSKEEILQYEPHCSGLKGIFVPQTGIVNYRLVSDQLAKRIEDSGRGKILTGEKVISAVKTDHSIVLHTLKGRFESTLAINCAGLYCDKIAEMAGEKLPVKIIPFRGEYYSIKPERAHLVKNLIYPVPDPNFPFLGVHFTRRITGEIEAGPNAVFAFKREGYTKSSFKWSEFWESIAFKGFRKVSTKYWQTGLGEYKRSFFKPAFVKALQKLVPAIQEDDLEPAGAGVRAQACDANGGLIDDFYIHETANFIHVLNAPSPAATSSLSIGLTIAEKALFKLESK